MGFNSEFKGLSILRRFNTSRSTTE